MRQMHESSTQLVFPSSMRIGVATSPFQYEGNKDKTRRSDWDAIPIRESGFDPNGYHPNWLVEGVGETDIATLGELGLRTLRIGIEWARIMPDRGRIDSAAVKRYQDLTEFAKQLGMSPCITLNHFTLPNWIAENGGWENKKNLEYFKGFSTVVADAFGDTDLFVTLNEPSHLVSMGYLYGEWPPYKKWAVNASNRVIDNLVEANRVAYEAIKRVNSASLVGVAHPIVWLQPANPRAPLDRMMSAIGNYITNYLITDKMNDNTDFIGVNFYHGYNIKFNPTKLRVTMRDDIHGATKTAPFLETVVPKSHASDAGWPIVPDFFLDALLKIYQRYKKPIVITENGIDDKADQKREYFIRHHLRAIHEAQKRGVIIDSYFYWGAVDSWEWKERRNYSFGLIELDPKTGERRVRESACFLGNVSRTHVLDVNHESMESDAYPERIIFKAATIK